MTAINIDYTAFDFDALKNELIQYLRETQTFKDAEVEASNINTLVGLYAYIGSLFGYYTNSVANEVFLPSAKRYKNLNRIATLLAYYPRGQKAAGVNAIGALAPEYCFGKENEGFDIPAYSIFPSNKTTPDGIEFIFTNPIVYPYIIKGYGTAAVSQEDFTYSGQQLPLTQNAEYWGITAGTTGTTASPITPDNFLAANIELVCSDTSPLSILNRLATDNYKRFDTENSPLFDPQSPSSVGQPFTRNISTNNPAFKLEVGEIYYIVWNYSKSEGAPFLSILTEGAQLDERRDDVITSLILEENSNDPEFYTLREVQNNSKGRFYKGVLGSKNLDSVTFEYDIIEGTTNSIKQIHMDINKTGDQLPFQVLVEGTVYTFRSGRISSQVFDRNNWDVNQSFYNVNLSIVSPEKPELNYNSELIVTPNNPGTNEVTIAKIYPQYTDPETNTNTISKRQGSRFGDFQVVPDTEISPAAQKTGFVEVASGVESLFVSFDTQFAETSISSPSDYIVVLTPEDNIQTWVSSKTEDGFVLNIEPNVGFTGKVYWLAIQFDTTNTRSIPVFFDEPIPQIDGQDTDYTVFVTPSDNSLTWVSDKTSEGFVINTERPFEGTITWSTFAFLDDENVRAEANSSTLKRGTETLTNDSRTKSVRFDVDFPDDSYGLHFVADQNLTVWYTNKTSTGFTLNVEEGIEGQVNIDWFADFSTEYKFQKHGMVNLLGQLTSRGTLPGLRFTNISETFRIDSLKQGNILFSFINSNGSIDTANNSLNLDFTADRTSFKEMKFYAGLESISYTDIRVFVKNDGGDWEEWSEGSAMISSTEIEVGSKVFFIRVNEYKQVEISFGDGQTFGTNPYGKEIFIFGLDSVGRDGNIPPNTLSNAVTLSKSILGDDNVTLQFEEQFVQLVGLKRDTTFAADEVFDPTSLYDTEGTRLTSNELSIRQNESAFGGAFPETTEELRRNASTSNLRQNRLVSLGDYKGFVEQAFSDYVIKAQVLSYEEIEESGFLPQGDLEKFWFNNIFIVALPRSGTFLTKDIRDLIVNSLNDNVTTMLTVNHQLFAANKVPIDVRVRYKPLVFAIKESIESSITKVVTNFFNEENHELGETIQHSDLLTQISAIPGIDWAEVAMHKDIGNKLTESDYDIDAVASTADAVQEVKRNKILELLAKDPSLLTIVEPLFDVTNQETGEREWVFTLNINLEKFEFPIIGDIIIEVAE